MGLVNNKIGHIKYKFFLVLLDVDCFLNDFILFSLADE